MNIYMRIGILLILLLCGYAFLHSDSGQWLLSGNVDIIASQMHEFGGIAVLIMFLLIMLQAFFPYIPFIVLAGVCVLLFGLHWGFLLSWLATSTGSFVTFLVARYAAREWAEKKVMYIPFIQRLNERMKTKGFTSILISRLVAVVPSGAINLAAGISKISKTAFALGTFIGNVPVVFVESLLGHYFFHFEEMGGRFALLIIPLLFLFFILKKRLNKLDNE